MDINAIATMLLQAGGTGVLAFVLWVLLNRITDKQTELTNAFKLEQEALRGLFELEVRADQEEQQTLRMLFQSELKAERLMCESHFSQLTEIMMRSQEALLRSNMILEAQSKLLGEHHRFAMTSVTELKNEKDEADRKFGEENRP